MCVDPLATAGFFYRFITIHLCCKILVPKRRLLTGELHRNEVVLCGGDSHRYHFHNSSEVVVVVQCWFFSFCLLLGGIWETCKSGFSFLFSFSQMLMVLHIRTKYRRDVHTD